MRDHRSTSRIAAWAATGVMVAALTIVVAGPAAAADTGFRAPADADAAPNTWNNRASGKTLNGAATSTGGAGHEAYAQFQNNSAGTLVGTLDAAIPDGATITGIEAEVVARYPTQGNPPCAPDGSSLTFNVALSGDGGATYTAFKSINPLTNTLTAYTLGGPADLWGMAWAEPDFTNADFRAKVAFTTACGGGSVAMDVFQVKVYFT